MAASYLERVTGALQIIGSALALKGAVGTATISATTTLTITFADAGRWIDLVGAQVAGALVWRAVGSDATLSTV